jgi:hypothetical protein
MSIAIYEVKPESKKPNYQGWAFCLKWLVAGAGFEPTTFGL